MNAFVYSAILVHCHKAAYFEFMVKLQISHTKNVLYDGEYGFFDILVIGSLNKNP